MDRVKSNFRDDVDGVEDTARPLDIAVVGLAAMFAGSPGVDAFWRTILSGEDVLTEVPAERWDPAVYYTPAAANAEPGRRTVSKWGGFLDPVPFDPLRYGIPPNALGSIDPSQLLALQVADQAMRDAGYPFDAADAEHSRTGVIFAAEPGSDTSTGLTLRSLLPAYLGEVPPEFDVQLPQFTEDTFPGHLANVIAGRIGNRFNLGGPNFTVDAACAAALAALDTSCMYLAQHRADLMLCGAVDLHNSIGDFLMFGSVNALSPNGRIATFDSSADGTTLGEGVACVVLKRLADAEGDGDRIYAVIKGVGAASDGRARSLTAPVAEGQIRAMRRAYRQAGISPREVGLVEAHGTGTVLGDQTELESLTTIFASDGSRPGGCVLGSVKSQVGHTKCAAGLAGLIKVVLAIYHGVLPPTANLTRPNPTWHPDQSPFAFLTAPRPWAASVDRRLAGLSSFGFGGTDFHVVLGGHQATPEPEFGLREWPAELFWFRGACPADVHRAVRDLADALEAPKASLRHLAASAARDAEAADGPVMAAVVARDIGELRTALRRVLDGEHHPAAGVIQPPQRLAETGHVAVLFPGQGSQRPGSLAELFVAFPELRRYLHIGQRWAGALFPAAAFDPDHTRAQEDRLRDTRVAQPVLGVCGLAVNHLLDRLGVRPDMYGGHSHGELTALSAAGSFDPATLVELSEARADAILSAAGADPGTMAAVNATAEQVTELLAGHVVTLANLNAPGQVVISGATAAVDAAAAVLAANGLTVRPLQVACAFHSPVVAGASATFAATLAATPVRTPGAPVWSNRTAAPYPPDPAQIREQMAAQISSGVRFSDQVNDMYEAGARVFVEAGPGHVLTGLVGATLGDRPHLAVACDGPRGLRAFLIAAGQLACAGVPVDLGWLFRGRAEPAASAPAHPRWTVSGQLIRDQDGGYLPGANVPARMLKEFRVSTPATAVPSTREEMLAEYLRASRDMITAHRDVMLSFLGNSINHNGGASPHSVMPVPSGAAVRTAPTPVPADVPAAQVPAAQVPAAEIPVQPVPDQVQDTLIALISERTGYPVDLIEPDLDLEADLSIDSIKRTEIAGEMLSRLGLTDGTRKSAPEELVRARTVRAITEWLERETAESSPAEDAASGPVTPSGQPPAFVGTAPVRLVPGLASAASKPMPVDSLSDARFLITGDTSIGEKLAAMLREHGAQAEQTSAETITRQHADGIILLDGLDGLGEPAESLPAVLFPRIRQHLILAAETTGPRWVLAAGVRGNPAMAGLAGLFRSIAVEYPGHVVRYAEFGAAADPATMAGLLLAELLDEAPEPVVYHADGTRARLDLAPASVDLDLAESAAPGDVRDAAAEAMGLSGESTIVAIGGARGITALFARQIAAAARCRIELIGRTPLPAEPVADDIAAAPDATAIRAALARAGARSPAEIGRATDAILAVREIEETLDGLRELGCEARYHCADAQDEEAIHRILKVVREDNGGIDGVVYGAGVIEDRLIHDKDPESFNRVFRTKVSGAEITLSAIEELGCSPAFVVLYGSIAATHGSRGQADYAAANDALEALGTAWAARTGQRCLTVHWGPWAPSQAHPGMVTPELARRYEERGMAMIDPDRGAQALLRELAWGDPKLTSIVYTGQ